MVTLKENFKDTMPFSEEEQLSEQDQKILFVILRKPITRKDLCKRFKMAWTTMYDHLAVLEKMKYIKRLPLKDGSRGTPKKYWMNIEYDEKEFQKDSLKGKIMELLQDKEYHDTVELSKELEQSAETIRVYLKELQNAGKVKTEKAFHSEKSVWRISE